jgi:hypothetical protein
MQHILMKFNIFCKDMTIADLFVQFQAFSIARTRAGDGEQMPLGALSSITRPASYVDQLWVWHAPRQQTGSLFKIAHFYNSMTAISGHGDRDAE